MQSIYFKFKLIRPHQAEKIEKNQVYYNLIFSKCINFQNEIFLKSRVHGTDEQVSFSKYNFWYIQGKYHCPKQAQISLNRHLFHAVFKNSFIFSFQVKWYRDTMLLDPNESRLMEKFGIRHTLVLRKVAEEDFGNYSCSAENHLGKSRAFIEVSGT